MSWRSLFNASKLADDLDAISASQAMIWFKPDGTVLSANENFCKTLGYELSEIVGKHHRIFCEDAIRNSPDYVSFWNDLAKGNFKSGQFRRLSKTSQDVWIEATYNPVFHGNKVVRILKLASDITKTKIQALDDNNRLRAIDQSQAIIEFEPDGRVFKVNDNFLSAMGYQENEVLGQHHSMFCDPAYRNSSDYQRFWERLRAGEYIADNFMRVGKGGRKVWIQAAYTPVFSSRGVVYKVVKVATDITARMVAVETIGKAIGRLASGDLTVEITDKIDMALEQTRLDFNNAARSLESTVGSIQHSAEVLAANAEVIRSVSDNIARNTEQQAASVEETAAAIDHITTTVRDSSSRAAEASQLVAATRTSAEVSGQIVDDATNAMGKIEESSKEIENIISVIDEIAFQTNLLALNAGVEAARAGEAGKGFAVVAQEVRELAQRSAKAAKEIKALIAASAGSVDHGVKLVAQTGDALRDIVQKVLEVDGNVQAISAAARDQTIGINEINASIGTLDKGAQTNAATVEEANAAAQTLAEEASHLYDMIARFKVARKAPVDQRIPRKANAA
ncbi:methyl-accepting chemotaxis protein [Allorhizobium pseudoryzae]|uniref:methyl-accepting chemotaxis protein n=1 Tax=Allorhizobium pseudoryzae TaxID=379684 RepID=UPI003D022D09